MAVYTMADTHLSGSVMKPMDKFGARWTDYTEKIRKRWSSLVTESDTVVIPGDFSWAMQLEEAESDFRFIASLPGRKIISKGNHDYWWTTSKKMTTFLQAKRIEGISFLHNNAYIADDILICGSRGWFVEEKLQADIFSADYEKLISRECERISFSVNAGRNMSEGRKLYTALFLHFPPVFGDFVCREIIETVKSLDIDHVYYGHIHGNYLVPSTFEYEGVKLSLVSADYLDFTPQRIFTL